MRALFLDRDGTVCEELGYLPRADRLRLIPGSAEAIRLAREGGFRVVVVTNQSGVARGLFDEAALASVHRRLRALLAEQGARLDGIYVCPHHPSEGAGALRRACDCRKPAPGLLLRAAEELDLDLAASFTIGDRYRDLASGARAGTRAILVRTGYGAREFEYHARRGDDPPDHVAADLLEAVRWVLETAGPARPAGGRDR